MWLKGYDLLSCLEYAIPVLYIKWPPPNTIHNTIVIGTDVEVSAGVGAQGKVYYTSNGCLAV